MNRPTFPTGGGTGQRVKSFIVRLWRRPEGFKIEARPLTGGENRTFTDLEKLFTYLREQAEPAPNSGEEGR